MSGPRPRLLVVKLSSLGDLFHALPAVGRLREALGADVDWAVQREYADLVERFEPVDRVIAFDRHGFPRGAATFVRALRARRYDAVVDMQGLLKSALIARLARTRRRVGPSFHREGAWLCYGEIAGRRDRNRHAVEEAMDMVRHFGFEPGPARFEIDVPPAALEGPRPRVGLVPCSRWESKNWPEAHFAALARALAADGAGVYAFGGPADRAVCERVAGPAGAGGVSLAGAGGLVDTLGNLAAMDLVIANDSGPVHMAAAVGTPCLVLFGPTDPRRTGPYGDPHRVLTPPGDCGPCFERRCSRSSSGCMAAIEVERVLDNARDMLKTSAGRTEP